MSEIPRILGKTSTLGLLEDLFFKNGHDHASAAFQSVFSKTDRNYYVHLRPGQGKEVTRTDATGVETVEYLSFDPPSFWDNPYQVMLVVVKDDRSKTFLYHDGEEFLIPIEGPGVNYDFFWSDPNDHIPPHVFPGESEPAFVGVDHAIRIQPQIPHRAWSAGSEDTRCWMVTRPLANKAAQIYVEPLREPKNKPNSRQASQSELEKPGHYSLRAWRISENIRLSRQRGNLRVAQVADACEIDAAYLSKIESGTANVSLDLLRKICHVLDLDVTQLITPPGEAFRVERLLPNSDQSDRETCSRLFQKPKPSLKLISDPIKRRFKDHYVHPRIWRFEKDVESELNEQCLSDAVRGYAEPCSWIVIEGRAVVDIEFDNKKMGEVLEPESVLHLREGGPRLAKVLPLEDTTMLQIYFDKEDCHCRD